VAPKVLLKLLDGIFNLRF